MRVVVDTSVWVSGIFWTGLPHQLLQRWRDGEFEVMISPALLAELGRSLQAVAQQIGADSDLAAAWMELVELAADILVPSEAVTVCRDPADNAVLEAAVAAHADCMISGDQDLLVLAQYHNIPILTPREFANLLQRPAP